MLLKNSRPTVFNSVHFYNIGNLNYSLSINFTVFPKETVYKEKYQNGLHACVCRRPVRS